ncbi:hypothetical protein JANAI62_10560 [Jannaschia pagri]|uniref:DUF2927 domain-containing protein n=1 Tax=Jannaschia pagri TaxID=2829797 RepID=A0ABQ4NJ53_9RHOB|nr:MULTISPECIES: DUF2927 domain-containing protein [unclassified Jannaschia]GIT90601.1 hypothetical protein JANAI61_10590 [Jannaschia sp. AI_61]GIT94433.1 hypothetical protein JANAI62_10560 [Jannaschia sp. AI_62]
MLRVLTLLAATALASCTPSAPPSEPAATRAAVVTAQQSLPAPRRFSGRPALRTPVQPNGQLARDFMALTFQLETGRALPVFTRFEGPVTVAVEGNAPTSLTRDLDDLLTRLRREAGIDISRAGRGEAASITITALPRATLQAEVPGAACFVVPRVSGWRDYLGKRTGPAIDWTTLRQRTRASIFLPSDVSAQEIRDCLHEELAQALGPLNDLYRLPHSVFNDDNIHVVLTDYDMTLLRATYDPALRSGMTQQSVAKILPQILARVNPKGRTADRAPILPSGTAWTSAIRAALSPAGSDRTRLAAAQNAVTLAESAGWRDNRLPSAHLALGRAALPLDGDLAIDALLTAGSGFRDLYGDGIHAAHAAQQLAAFALTTGQPDGTLRIVDRAIPAADDAQNPSVLATLLLLRAEAMDLQGNPSDAARTRREGLAWGRTAWGDSALMRRDAEIRSLAPGA